MLAAFVAVFGVVGLVVALERVRTRQLASMNQNENLELLGYLDDNDIPKEQEKPDD